VVVLGRVALVVLTAAVALGVPRTARAGRPVVGLLDVRADGVEQIVIDRFIEGIEEGLSGGDHVSAPRERLAAMLARSAWSPACSVGPCLSEVRAQTGAALVVTGGISGSGLSYRFTLTLIETEHGRVIGQKAESCPACTIDDLASAVTLATIELVSGLAPVEGGEGLLDAERRLSALQGRVRDHGRSTRRTALLFVSAAVIAGVSGYYFLDQDRDRVGYPLLGTAGGLAAAGAVTFALSYRF
jgi:hypothetical protein